MKNLNERTVIPKKCVLYKQSRSSKWYCRIKLNDGSWHRAATGFEDLVEATDRAHRLYYETQVKGENNLPQTTRSFSSVAKTVINELESKEGTHDWKKAYVDYIKLIKKYQIPFFNRTKLDNVGKRYLGYIDYVAEQIGRQPAASTVNNHHAALNLVLTKAKEKGWVTNISLPVLKNTGKKSSRRPTFSSSEYNSLVTRLRHWKDKDTHRKKDKEVRQMLYDYVLFLAYTGIRQGREAMDIKWQNISFATSKSGNQLVVISVLKKKGRSGTEEWRKVVMRNNEISDAIKLLERIKNRNPYLANKTLEQVIKQKSEHPIFVLSDLSQPKRLDGTFKKFLVDVGMGYGEEEKWRTLYSFRHFYATRELTRKNPISIALLSKQMGTSIAMIEKYYGHLDTVKQGDALSGWTEF